MKTLNLQLVGERAFYYNSTRVVTSNGPGTEKEIKTESGYSQKNTDGNTVFYCGTNHGFDKKLFNEINSGIYGKVVAKLHDERTDSYGEPSATMYFYEVAN